MSEVYCLSESESKSKAILALRLPCKTTTPNLGSVKGCNVRYNNKEALLFTVDPYFALN